MAFIDTYFKEVEQRFAVMKQEREPLEQAARLLFEAEKEHLHLRQRALAYDRAGYLCQSRRVCKGLSDQ